MEQRTKAPDYRGTWKDWPFLAAAGIALLALVGAMAGGKPALWLWLVAGALVLVGLVRGGTFSPRR